MTEAHAFSEDLAGGLHGGETRWPPPDAAMDMAGGPATAVTRPPPVPAPAGPAGLAGEDGTRLVAGLTWEIASGPEAPVLVGGAPHVLRLPTRRARLAGAKSTRCGSLLLAMAADLTTVHCPGASGPWAFIAEIPVADRVPTIWMALADIAAPDEERDGPSAEDVPLFVTPRPGPERTFEDPDDALLALKEQLDITDIAGIAVRWLPVTAGMTAEDTHRGPMVAGIAMLAETLDLHDVGPDVPAPPGVGRGAAAALPVFVPPRQVPVRLVGALGIGAGALLAGIFVIVPMIEATLQPEAAPPPEMVSVRVAEGAFAAACTAALDAWWPRITAWRVESAGCAMGGHLPRKPVLTEPGPTGRASRPMIVWRHLVPEAGRNEVLARASAEKTVASWPHQARIDGTGLALWRTESLPLVRTHAAGDDAAPPDPETVRGRLAALWADSPGAVSLLREAPGRDLVRIATSGATTADAVLARAALVPGIAPARLVQPADGPGELVIAPVTTRKLPVTYFENTDGGPSQ